MIKSRPVFCSSSFALAMLSCTMLTFALAGCGGGDDAESDTADAGSSTAAGDTAASAPSAPAAGGPGGAPPEENMSGMGGGPPAGGMMSMAEEDYDSQFGGDDGGGEDEFGMSSDMMSMGGIEEDEYNMEFGGAEGGMGMGMGMNGGQNVAARPSRPPRPESFDQWTPTNFREAVQDGDNRVLEAIADRGVAAAGNERYAEMLEELLGMSPSLGAAPAANAGGMGGFGGYGADGGFGMEGGFGEDEFGMENEFGMEMEPGMMDSSRMQGATLNGQQGTETINNARARMGYGSNMGSSLPGGKGGASAPNGSQQGSGRQMPNRAPAQRSPGAEGRGGKPQSAIDGEITHPSQSVSRAVAVIDSGERIPADNGRVTSDALALDSLTVMLGEAAIAAPLQALRGIPDENEGAGRPGAAGRTPGGPGAPGMTTPAGKGGMSSAAMMGGPGLSEPGMNEPGMGTMGMGSMGMGGMGMGAMGGAASNNAGGFAPVGTIDREQFVGTIVQALFDNGTDDASGTINKLSNGEIDTGLEPDSITGLIVDALVERSDARSREFLADLVRQNSGNGAVARSLAGYGAGMIDRFLGVHQVLAAANQSQTAQQGFGGNAGFGGNQGFGGNNGFGGEEAYPGGEDMADMEMGMEEGGFDPAAMQRPGGFGRRPPAGGAMAPGRGGPMMGGFGDPAAGNQAGGIELGMIDVTSKDISDAAFPDVAAYLLGDELTQSVASRLDTSNDAAAALDMFGLAATLPNPNTRRAAMAFLRRNEKTSMGGLVSSGVFETVVRDPGVLVMLKTLLPPKSAAAATRRDAGEFQANSVDNTEVAVRQVADRVRDQLRLASMQGGQTTLPQGFPIKLHRNAEIDVAFQTSWPRGVDATAGEGLAVAATTLYYARSVIAPQSVREMQSVVAHYERSTRGRKHEYQAEKILRYDTQVTLPSGAKRSIDVYIAEAQPAGGGNFGGGFNRGGGFQEGGGFGNQGSQGLASAYTMELFIVEIDDPEATISEDATTASTEASGE